MIVTRHGRSYDTSDGSEQPHAASDRKQGVGERANLKRWEDDGASPRTGPVASPAEITGRKPAWSVLSLHDLNEARRRSAAARPRQEAERIDREHLLAEQNRERRTAAAAKAEMDRYRNAWETT